ncbi:unnamed protein product, partial [Ixodes persulcatus]
MLGTTVSGTRFRLASRSGSGADSNASMLEGAVEDRRACARNHPANSGLVIHSDDTRPRSFIRRCESVSMRTDPRPVSVPRSVTSLSVGETTFARSSEPF